METMIINSNMAIVKVKNIMPTKSNVYDIACRLGIAVDRYKVSTDHTDTITITFEKIAAVLPPRTEEEMRQQHKNFKKFYESPEGQLHDKTVSEFFQTQPTKKHIPSRWENVEELMKFRKKEMGEPLDHVVKNSPRMLIDKLNSIISAIKKTWESSSPSNRPFQERYKGELTEEEVNQMINELQGIDNKYNEILEKSITTDLQREVEPYVNKISEWENILNNYLVKEEVLDPETGEPVK